MATLKVALLWAFVATVGWAFFILRYRSSARLSDDLTLKLTEADSWQLQLNEEIVKLRRDIRVLRHDVDDYRQQLDAKSDSLRNSEKAEKECKANLEKLEAAKTRSDTEAHAREDEIEDDNQKLSQQLEEFELKFQTQQDNLATLQLQVNETASRLLKAENKAQQLQLELVACRDLSSTQVVKELNSTSTATLQSTNVTIAPARNKSVDATTEALVSDDNTTVAASTTATNVSVATAITKDTSDKSENVTNATVIYSAAAEVTKVVDTKEANGTTAAPSTAADTEGNDVDGLLQNPDEEDEEEEEDFQ